MSRYYNNRDWYNRRGRRRLFSGSLTGALLILIMSAALILVIRTRGGAVVKPIKSIGASEAVFFSQCDQEWASDRLGASAYTMKSSGCLVTCIASALSMQSTAINGIEVLTPKTLNAAFSAAGAYDAQGNLMWDALRTDFSLNVDILSDGAPEILNGYLASGIYPIVRVRVNGVGSYHFVLIVKSENGEYLCMDPLKQEETLTPLSDYGNRIYAVRCIYRQDREE